MSISCSGRVIGRAPIVMIVALTAVGGCQKSAFEVAPVRGKVSMAGQPLSQGKVMFAPVSGADSGVAGKAAVGLIQPDGSFALTTYAEGDGAVIGEHWVTVFVPKQSPTAAAGLPEAAAADVEFKRIAVPTRQVVVAGQDNQIEIQL